MVVVAAALGVGWLERFAFVLLLGDTAVGGNRYWSLATRGGSTNGFSYIALKKPLLIKRNDPRWVECAAIHPRIKDYLQNEAGIDIKGPTELLVETSVTGYKAYIRSLDKVIFVRGFPDFAGAGPSLEEKRVCRDPSRS